MGCELDPGQRSSEGHLSFALANLAAFLGLLWLAPGADAEQPTKVPVVAVLTTYAAVSGPIYGNLRTGLRDLGYEDGRNIRLEIVTAAGQVGRLPALAHDLIRNNVDVIRHD